MTRRFDPKYDGPTLDNLVSIGLNPKPWPNGDEHHTDFPFTEDDERISQLAHFLGGLFVDKMPPMDDEAAHKYFDREMTSLDQWRRVARALRIHGLKIVNAS